MSTKILEDARQFLYDSLQGKQNHLESKHPWRTGWEFAVIHSLRVETYTTKILAREQHSLSEHEFFLVRLAAILHDIGRLEKREGHAALGAEIAQKWLREYSKSPLEGVDIERVVEIIADHSNKNNHEPDFSKAVLKDADTLDEIGAMSVFMTGNWVDAQSPFFFYGVRHRLIDIELPFCDQKMAILNTNGGREILGEKKAFLENFIAQLTDEMQVDETMEQMMFHISGTGG